MLIQAGRIALAFSIALPFNSFAESTTKRLCYRGNPVTESFVLTCKTNECDITDLAEYANSRNAQTLEPKLRLQRGGLYSTLYRAQLGTKYYSLTFTNEGVEFYFGEPNGNGERRGGHYICQPIR
ncbi:MAG TPA: hypothetical protein VFV50_05205 [Bdellovibrionales bacterium]|nr:hypothetical protein [Bdellovibrionales bacterium]